MDWNPNTILLNGNSFLVQAVLDDDYELCLHLLRSGADVNMTIDCSYMITDALSCALERHQWNIVKLLINAGADLKRCINKTFVYFDVLMCNPSCSDCIEGCSFLVNNLSDINAVDELGNTWLYNVLQTNSDQSTLINLLIDHGAEMNWHTCPIHISVLFLNKANIITLLNRGLNPNNLTLGYTPLWTLMDEMNIGYEDKVMEIAEVLIKYGASLYIINENGLTVLEHNAVNNVMKENMLMYHLDYNLLNLVV